jgi:hypothetical protein
VQKIRINAGPRGEAFQTIGDYASRGSESALAGNECAQRNEVTQKQCSNKNKTNVLTEHPPTHTHTHTGPPRDAQA